MADRATPERGRRVRLDTAVTIELEDGSSIAARLLDLSSSGFKIESGELFEPGEAVTLRMDGDEPMPATIRWVTGSIAGGAFATAPPALG